MYLVEFGCDNYNLSQWSHIALSRLRDGGNTDYIDVFSFVQLKSRMEILGGFKACLVLRDIIKP